MNNICFIAFPFKLSKIVVVKTAPDFYVRGRASIVLTFVYFAEILAAACRNAGIVYVMTNGIELVGTKGLRLLARKSDLSGLKKG